ncbi:MAG: type II secretion system protein GspM [Rhizorhabdus sp.]
MIGTMRSWWRERTPREHGLLILLALIAVPLVGFYGVVRPFGDVLERTQLTRDGDARALGDVLLMAGKIRAADRPARNPALIETLVASEAERAGFTVTGITRDGDGALLTIAAVRPQPFFAWLAAVKQRRGLFVTKLSAQANSDKTLSISARLERGR